MHMQRCIFETYITWFCFADALLYKAFMMSVRRYRGRGCHDFHPYGCNEVQGRNGY